ncbi:hypothetical protein HDC30_002394 [Pseudomonas sp. JAI115]|uniref:hypothetical protein n=1 Tax=Pseudomonas sp. JAI115 TaxID=2723061 RepID=UPI00160AAB7E|nr:hypothetical protein [Pseudomonas sp. JAI115]MBB6155171.1 hypothetical protein [Pseudomonas sp. JAI115]
MPMIDSNTFKLQLDVANRTRDAMVDHQLLPQPYDPSCHQIKATELLEEYQWAANSLAHQIKRVVERAGG